MSVFNSKPKDHTKATMFLDQSGGVNVQRYDTLKYRQFDKLETKDLIVHVTEKVKFMQRRIV